MRFLLDTCVISECKQKKPNPVVLNWIDKLPIDNVKISILTLGEIEKGIEKLAHGSKRSNLKNWYEELQELFGGKIIPISQMEISAWAKMEATTELNGNTLTSIDGLIAASAIAHHLIVATRNVDDMLASGVPLYNPWTQEFFNRD